MQRQKNKSVRIIALVLAALMIVTLFVGAVASITAQGRNLAQIDREINEARSQISNLESRAADLSAQMGDVNARIAALREQEGGYLEELNVLQEQLDLLRDHIELTEEQIAIYERMIADKQIRLEEAMEREADQLDLYRRRIRAMEEGGRISYIQLLLSARSFSELITRIHDAGEIMEADQRIAEALARYREAVQIYKAELLADQAELEILIAQLEAERDQLQIEEANLEERIREVEARIEAQEIERAALQAQYEAASEEALRQAQLLGSLDAARQEAIRELERQAAAGQSPGGGGMGGAPARAGTGSFIWPSDFTTRVSSGFGPRQSPGGIGSTNHGGIDIAAPGINGTNILAAASGVVSFSGWMGGFGNTVMINHGNGYVTLYAHNSANLVQRGANVVQGQVIARVGSTGNSTGPHIHFEIIRNGVRVNPMLYFS